MSITRRAINEYCTTTTRMLASLDRDALAARVRGSMICDLLPTVTDLPIAVMCTIYFTTLRQILDGLAPVKTVTTKRRPQSPWFDSECRTCQRKARSLERRYRFTKAYLDLVAWKEQLVIKRELFLQKEASYWSKSISICNGNSKHLWRCLNAIMMRDTSGALCQPSTVTAASLSSFFIDKVEAIRASL